MITDKFHNITQLHAQALVSSQAYVMMDLTSPSVCALKASSFSTRVYIPPSPVSSHTNSRWCLSSASCRQGTWLMSGKPRSASHRSILYFHLQLRTRSGHA